MQRLEVSGAVRPLEWSLGVKGLMPLWCFTFALLFSASVLTYVESTPQSHSDNTQTSPVVPLGVIYIGCTLK